MGGCSSFTHFSAHFPSERITGAIEILTATEWITSVVRKMRGGKPVVSYRQSPQNVDA